VTVGVTWLVEDRLLLLNSWGKVNVDELMAMDNKIGAMIENSPAPLVHGIHDHSKAAQIPSPKDLMKVKSAEHPRVGWLIFIGMDNKLIKFFLSVAGQAFSLRLRFMDTLEDALTFLQDVDSTLPDLKAIDLTAAEARIHETAVTL
jgi:hypothetical protein